jgi:L-fuculose-phosphate aldolase
MLDHTTIHQKIVKLIELGKRLYDKNCVSAFDGNLSVRLEDNLFLVTKSGCMKGFLKPEDFLLMDKDGKKINRPELLNSLVVSEPSSESIMHLTVYENQPLAQCVFHAHPPTAVAYSVAFPKEKHFPLKFISELILALGSVPIVEYQRPGSKNMGTALIPFLNEAKVMVLQFHGVLSWGESIEEAYLGVERLEHAAEIFMKAKMMGQVNDLPDEEIKILLDMRKKIGFKTL